MAAPMSDEEEIEIAPVDFPEEDDQEMAAQVRFEGYWNYHYNETEEWREPSRYTFTNSTF